MMAIAYLFEIPEVTLGKYDRIIDLLNLRNRTPEGQIFHVAGPLEGGGVRVVDVWETEEACNKFFKEKLSAAFRQNGLNLEKVKPTATWKVHNMYRALTPVH